MTHQTRYENRCREMSIDPGESLRQFLGADRPGDNSGRALKQTLRLAVSG